jgi:hypothetical protein
MKNEKIIEAAALNITTHPHTTQKYIDIFNKMHELKMSAKMRDKYYGVIGWIRPIENEKPEEGLYGEIYRYLNIDPFATWLNKKELEPVDIDDEKDTPPVSEDLKPHLEKIYFHFYPKKHRLIFDTNKISPSTAQKFFTSMLKNKIFSEFFNFAEVTVESKKEIIETILKIYRLSTLEIIIKRPNSDDHGCEDEKDILELLEEENAKSFYEKKVAPRGEGLKPSEKTIKLMRVATSNGIIKANGYNDVGEKVKEITEDHPVYESITYSQETSTFSYAFNVLSKAILSKIT